jgi:hypothetical protein
MTVSNTFNSLFKVLFTFPSRYLCSIGFLEIFSLERDSKCNTSDQVMQCRWVRCLAWDSGSDPGRGSVLARSDCFGNHRQASRLHHHYRYCTRSLQHQYTQRPLLHNTLCVKSSPVRSLPLRSDLPNHLHSLLSKCVTNCLQEIHQDPFSENGWK